MAVNGYDEPKDEVQAFVDKEKLKHPILLMGGKTAADLFQVEGFPTVFWIDHDGRIVHREVGFAPDMAPVMEKRIERYIEARGKAVKS